MPICSKQQIKTDNIAVELSGLDIIVQTSNKHDKSKLNIYCTNVHAWKHLIGLFTAPSSSKQSPVKW